MFSREKARDGGYTVGQDFIFGVELEMCVCDIDDEWDRSCCDDPNDFDEECCQDDFKYMLNYFPRTFFKKFGREVNVIDIHDDTDNYFIWNVMYDMSVSCKAECRPANDEYYHAMELISPILEWNDEGMGLLTDVLTDLHSKFTFEVNETQGLHINMSYYGQKQDIESRDYTRILKFFEAWFYFEPELLTYLPRERYDKIVDEDIAVPLTVKYPGGFEQFKTAFLKEDPGSGPFRVFPTKYVAVNLKPDRFEVRLLHADMSVSHIVEWTDFCLNFLKMSLTRNFEGLTLSEFLS